MKVEVKKRTVYVESSTDLDVLAELDSFMEECDETLIVINRPEHESWKSSLKFKISNRTEVSLADLSRSGDLDMAHITTDVSDNYKGIGMKRAVEIMKGYLLIEGLSLPKGIHTPPEKLIDVTDFYN